MFDYFLGGKKITSPGTKNRIKNLRIPPAYTNVRIDPDPEARILYRATDSKGRSQYRYSDSQRKLADERKFLKMNEFGQNLPRIRTNIKRLLDGEDEPMGLALSLLDNTSLRVGNKRYEQQNGTYGITTLHPEHIKSGKRSITLEFKGKKGVTNKARLSKKLSDKIKNLRKGETPAEGVHDHNINYWLGQFGSFTARDFRTWGANAAFVEKFRKELENSDLLDSELKPEFKPESQTAIKRAVSYVVKCVSDKLSNTRTVARKHYVDPRLIHTAQHNPEIFLTKVKTKHNMKKDEALLMHIMNQYK